MSPFAGFETVYLPNIVRAKTGTAVPNHAIAALKNFPHVLINGEEDEDGGVVSKVNPRQDKSKAFTRGWLVIRLKILSNRRKK